MSKSFQFDLAAFIGRFQFATEAHVNCVREALQMAEHVLILIGSSDTARSSKNPFTWEERKSMFSTMLQHHLGSLALKRISFKPLPDFPNQYDRWQEEVQRLVSDTCTHLLCPPDPEVALVGHKKGPDGDWLDTFPQYGRIEATPMSGVNATELRKKFFEGGLDLSRYSTEIGEFLIDFSTTNSFARLRREHEAIESEKRVYARIPHPITLVAVDTVVIKSGHVLMVRRKDAIGDGLLALPGGFIDPNLELEDSAINKLLLKTNLPLAPAVLRGSICAEHVFSDPLRSHRARAISHTYLIRLRDSGPLPKVSPGANTCEALWVPFSELDPRECFEDHYHNIQAMRGKSPK